MKLRTIGLRISGASFGLVCFGLIARLWARSEIGFGSHYLTRVPSFFLIIITGGLSIWLVKLSGPWSAENKEAQTPKT